MLNNDSELYLLKNVELDADSEHTIDFDDATQQYNYFYSKIDRTLLNTDDNADFAYIREQKAINVAFNIDDLFGVNYLMYNNDKKWYYAYIIRKEFVSPETTKLHIKLDTYQTFMFDFELDECFVEREHQDRYEIVDNTTDCRPLYNLESEQLNKGDEYIAETIEDLDNPILASNGDVFTNNSSIYWLCVITSDPLNVVSGWFAPNNRGITNIKPTLVNNVPSNAYTYYIPFTKSVGLSDFAESATGFHIGSNVNNSEINAICQNPLVISASIVRQPPFNIKYSTSGHYYYLDYKEDINIECYAYIGFINDKLTENSNYRGAVFFIEQTPRNYAESQPLLTYNFNRLINKNELNIFNYKDATFEPKLNTNEFKFIKISYGSKIEQEFKLEDFSNYNELSFKFLPPTNVNGGCMIVPIDYQGQEINYKKSITINSAFTDLPLVQDAWKQYMANNKNSLMSGFVTNSINTVASIGVGLATGGLGFAVAGVQALNHAGEVANKMAQIKDLKNAPDKINKTALDTFLDFETLGLKVKLYIYSIKNQFKNKIFNYLYHYGYKCNDFKKPNVRSRYYFNYIKTIDANIKSNISNEYITEIKALFDKGITIWHYRDDATFKGIRNYAYENVEMALMPTNE